MEEVHIIITFLDIHTVSINNVNSHINKKLIHNWKIYYYLTSSEEVNKSLLSPGSLSLSVINLMLWMRVSMPSSIKKYEAHKDVNKSVKVERIFLTSVWGWFSDYCLQIWAGKVIKNGLNEADILEPTLALFNSDLNYAIVLTHSFCYTHISRNSPVGKKATKKIPIKQEQWLSGHS